MLKKLCYFTMNLTIIQKNITIINKSNNHTLIQNSHEKKKSS